MPVYVHRDDGDILVSTDEGRFDQRFRRYPGSVWLPSKTMWKIPASAGMAMRMAEDSVSDSEPWEITPSMMKLIDRSYRQQSKAQAVAKSDNLTIPEHVRYRPWQHQLRAYHFAKHLPATMLAMDMGTGKTKVVYDLIQNRKIRNTLIVAPLQAIEDVWEGQFPEHWCEDVPVEYLFLYHGTKQRRMEQARALVEDHLYQAIIAINYEVVAQRPFADWAISIDWDLVVLDESHRIKSAGSKTSQFFHHLGRRAKKRICLTGTPMGQSPLDVYGQYRFLDPAIFGTNVEAFRNEYAIWGGYQNLEIRGYKNLDQLNKKFYSIAYRVTEDVLDLPPKQQVFRHTSLPDEATKMYKQLNKEFVLQIKEGTVTADNVLAKTTKLRQLTSGFIRSPEPNSKEMIPVHTAKADLLSELLEDLPLEEPLVIFAAFHADLDTIRAVVKKSGRSFGELSGRKDELKEWKTGHLDVLGVQIQAGSESIDLTRSRYGIYYSLGLSLTQYKQSQKRIHRPKQKRSSIFIHLLVKGTMDTVIMAAIRDNSNIIEYVLQMGRA